MAKSTILSDTGQLSKLSECCEATSYIDMKSCSLSNVIQGQMKGFILWREGMGQYRNFISLHRDYQGFSNPQGLGVRVSEGRVRVGIFVLLKNPPLKRVEGVFKGLPRVCSRVSQFKAVNN